MLRRFCLNTYLWEEPLDFLSSFCSLGVVQLYCVLAPCLSLTMDTYVLGETDAVKHNLSKMQLS